MATLVEHSGGGVELLARFEVPDRERGREGAHRQPPAGAERGGDPAEHLGLVMPAEQPEAALAQADRGVELAGSVELRARRAPRTSRSSCSAAAASRARRTNSALWSTPTTVASATGQRERVAPGTAPDVEHAHPRLERERVDEEVDLLLGAHRERVAQVRRPEVVGDRVEPVRVVDRAARRSRERGYGVAGETEQLWRGRVCEGPDRLPGPVIAVKARNVGSADERSVRDHVDLARRPRPRRARASSAWSRFSPACSCAIDVPGNRVRPTWPASMRHRRKCRQCRPNA